MALLSICPPGVVLPYAGSTSPDGWLFCDGREISRTTYLALFTAIGTAHGTGNGTSTFNIPDYRGRFLRGRDAGAGRDIDRASRTASGTGGLTGDNVGSFASQRD
jgi:microcystin-dependent protein